jgi:hypothetical protein
MDFHQWKREVIRLAKRAKIGHKVPASDQLFSWFSARWTPEQVLTRMRSEDGAE